MLNAIDYVLIIKLINSFTENY